MANVQKPQAHATRVENTVEAVMASQRCLASYVSSVQDAFANDWEFLKAYLSPVPDKAAALREELQQHVLAHTGCTMPLGSLRVLLNLVAARAEVGAAQARRETADMAEDSEISEGEEISLAERKRRRHAQVYNALPKKDSKPELSKSSAKPILANASKMMQATSPSPASKKEEVAKIERLRREEELRDYEDSDGEEEEDDDEDAYSVDDGSSDSDDDQPLEEEEEDSTDDDYDPTEKERVVKEVKMRYKSPDQLWIRCLVDSEAKLFEGEAENEDLLKDLEAGNSNLLRRFCACVMTASCDTAQGLERGNAEKLAGKLAEQLNLQGLLNPVADDNLEKLKEMKGKLEKGLSGDADTSCGDGVQTGSVRVQVKVDRSVKNRRSCIWGGRELCTAIASVISQFLSVPGKPVSTFWDPSAESGHYKYRTNVTFYGSFIGAKLAAVMAVNIFNDSLLQAYNRFEGGPEPMHRIRSFLQGVADGLRATMRTIKQQQSGEKARRKILKRIAHGALQLLHAPAAVTLDEPDEPAAAYEESEDEHSDTDGSGEGRVGFGYDHKDYTSMRSAVQALWPPGNQYTTFCRELAAEPAALLPTLPPQVIDKVAASGKEDVGRLLAVIGSAVQKDVRRRKAQAEEQEKASKERALIVVDVNKQITNKVLSGLAVKLSKRKANSTFQICQDARGEGVRAGQAIDIEKAKKQRIR
ncbi:hypothetical protein CYMTET_4607 [Cymbomonas tetramitiformis]|uniref:Uncharacterized protein n=1 Tax=Cymbomonas tetramitiformis TaxID=36881 RepID=A0AAE0H0U5_9CHLO|nr:hypothetical protein CYMTET_4607 [Cymbomonas tetramitiformis]